MKIMPEVFDDDLDFVIIGLGYESRSIFLFDRYCREENETVALGYEFHVEEFSYPTNKAALLERGVEILEGSDSDVIEEFKNYSDSFVNKGPKNVLLDITVMSRHRIAMVLDYLLCNLDQGSKLTITYALSSFVPPPEDTTPVRKVSEISAQFGGLLGDLSQPTSLIVGLGYEKNKALGLSNYLEAGCEFVFCPRSTEVEFEKYVRLNNEEFLAQVPSKNIFNYDVCSPYSTYLDLKSLLISISEYSRPLMVPLGPKILAAICVIIGREMHPKIPIWRVSSEHMEVPVERAANGEEISLSIAI